MTPEAAKAARDAALRQFVRALFGPRGTLRLHRTALGADLLRAPVNVALAPVYLLCRLAALLARLCRLPRIAGWLAARQIILTTNVSRQVALRTEALIGDLQVKGLQPPAPEAAVTQAVRDYTSVRNAIAEITTTCVVLICGYLIFRSATPGVISMAGPVAQMQAHDRAVDGFWAGQTLGSAYYSVFSTDLSTVQVVLTGVVLAMLASVVTTFAGVVADPVQVLTGTHRRRLARILDRLARTPHPAAGLAGEHVAARSADIADILMGIWRGLRG